MEDQEIIAHISGLADEERALEERHVGEGLTDKEAERLRSLEIALDQLWDLLRQRRALRRVGRDPDDAVARSEATVEGYQQ
jgi:Protein of unknown function (DUF2630)